MHVKLIGGRVGKKRNAIDFKELFNTNNVYTACDETTAPADVVADVPTRATVVPDTGVPVDEVADAPARPIEMVGALSDGTSDGAAA